MTTKTHTYDNLEIDQYGTKFWYKNGKYHREDGPAVEYANGSIGIKTTNNIELS